MALPAKQANEGRKANKRGAAVIGGMDGGFGQHAADLIGLRTIAVLQYLPDLFLAGRDRS